MLFKHTDVCGPAPRCCHRLLGTNPLAQAQPGSRSTPLFLLLTGPVAPPAAQAGGITLVALGAALPVVGLLQLQQK